jgi:hypothetical protein
MMAAEARGVPTTLAVIGWLDGMAEETKRSAGMEQLPTTPIGKSFFGLTREQIAAAVVEVAPAVVDGISTV